MAIFIILIFPIPILSQGFKEHGRPDDSVVIQKSMFSRKSFLFSLIEFYNVKLFLVVNVVNVLNLRILLLVAKEHFLSSWQMMCQLPK